jgi:hypothetical protein
MFDFTIIALLILTTLCFISLCAVTVYVCWVALCQPLLWMAADASRWMYHRYFVPSASHYEELRREMRSRQP